MADVRPSARLRLFVNGRFLGQRQTGVQRFGHEIVHSLDMILGEPLYRGLWETAAIITPPGVERPAGLRHFEHIQSGRFGHGYAWEQLDLPRLARRGVLLSLCNLGPVAKRQHVLVVHDAATRAIPEAFSRRFRLAYSFILPLLLRTASNLVTVSEFSRSELERWFRVPTMRFSVCREGAEHILAAPADDSILKTHGITKHRYFLGVGLGGANKNHELLLSAFSAAGLDGIQLILTGQRYEHLHGATAVPAGTGVIHTGYVTDAQLRGLYEGALALVYPSKYEGFGLPPAEAMACGCPVIISGQAALREVTGDAAKILPCDAKHALAAAMRQLAEDPMLRTQLSEQGRARARSLTWRAAAEHVFSECLAAA